jgi:predicted flap endonuclease-1-like 5' DNA nuclease
MTFPEEMQQLTQHLIDVQQGRIEAVASIHAELAEKLSELHADREAMASEQRQRLTRQADALSRDTAAFLQEQHAVRQTMAAEQRQRLAAEQASLIADMAALRKELRAAQQEMRAEMNEGREIWANFKASLHREAGKPVAATPPTPPTPPATEETSGPPPEEPPTAEGARDDDLTKIRGIGAGMMVHLNEAGIHTYAQLAESDPDELRQALGAASRLAKVEEWIAQAQDLLG